MGGLHGLMSGQVSFKEMDPDLRSLKTSLLTRKRQVSKSSGELLQRAEL
jgi:hypothetical protein